MVDQGFESLDKKQHGVVRCANCAGDHTSSFGGCELYKKHLKEVENKIVSSSVQSYRKYSQAVKNPSINEQTIQSLNENIDVLNTN